MKNVSIIIVDYNSHQWTKQCLLSLKELEQQDIKINIVIVDNGSKDPLELSSRFFQQSIKIIRSESNLGFTGGNNLGIKYAHSQYHPDYFLLLNNDTKVQRNFLQTMTSFMDNDSKIGVVAPKIYFLEKQEYQSGYHKAELGKVIWYAGATIDWDNLISFHHGVDEVDHGHFDFPQQVDFATGCCMLIKREVLEKIGDLDDELFLYWEDADFCLRAKAAGYQVWYLPTARIWHANAGSSQGVGSPTQEYYLSRNRLLIGSWYGSWKTKFIVMRLWLQFVRNKSKYINKAAWHFLFNQTGKQAVV